MLLDLLLISRRYFGKYTFFLVVYTRLVQESSTKKLAGWLFSVNHVLSSTTILKTLDIFTYHPNLAPSLTLAENISVVGINTIVSMKAFLLFVPNGCGCQS